MITTQDAALAHELRSMRSWGDMSAAGGPRDHRELAWNGRMSEIVAAVALEQLRGYPAHLEAVREGAEMLRMFLARVDGLDLVGPAGRARSAWCQAVLRLNERALGISKAALIMRLQQEGIHVWHARFEPLVSLTFFRENGSWRTWVPDSLQHAAAANYGRDYPGAWQVYRSLGLGINKVHLMNGHATTDLVRALERALVRHR
jgi:dTDP-4-amino-4,6-dideoxygalactose transaminase